MSDNPKDCDACGGTGDSPAGVPCICGGTGNARDAVVYLRGQLLKQMTRAETAEAEGKQLRAKMGEIADFSTSARYRSGREGDAMNERDAALADVARFRTLIVEYAAASDSLWAKSMNGSPARVSEEHSAALARFTRAITALLAVAKEAPRA